VRCTCAIVSRPWSPPSTWATDDAGLAGRLAGLPACRPAGRRRTVWRDRSAGADLKRFQQHFPEQYARLRILWKSSLIPHAVIVIRNDLPASLRAQVAAFITGYGKGKNAAREEANLKRIHDISGFAPAGNAELVPFADIEYTLEQRRANSAQWISDGARAARFRKIRSDHDGLVARLRGK
jgi:phosphonate transport system substrate-binding protein